MGAGRGEVGGRGWGGRAAGISEREEEETGGRGKGRGQGWREERKVGGKSER